MERSYLIDTNAVIELLGGTLPLSGSDWLQDLIAQNAHRLSVINEIELLGFNGEDTEMRVIEDFTAVTKAYPLSDAVVRKTISLRKRRRIKLPDAIIAATALIFDCILVTHNTSDFRDIEGLTVIDAHTR